MNGKNGINHLALDLTDREMGYLQAAVVDFFHKMRASEEDPTITWLNEEAYQAAKSLWRKVEEQTKMGEWENTDEEPRRHATVAAEREGRETRPDEEEDA